MYLGQALCSMSIWMAGTECGPEAQSKHLVITSLSLHSDRKLAGMFCYLLQYVSVKDNLLAVSIGL